VIDYNRKKKVEYDSPLIIFAKLFAMFRLLVFKDSSRLISRGKIEIVKPN